MAHYYNSDDSLSHIHRDRQQIKISGNTHSAQSLEDLRFEKPLK